MSLSGLFLVLVLQAAAESPREAFARAEAFYQDGQYDEAVAVYESMVAAGIEDGAVYYNLGNAHFKAGRLGLSVLSYERALKLMPGDEDARANLTFANELVAEPLDEAPLPLAFRWVAEIYRRLQPNFLARILSVAFIAGGILVSLVLFDAWPRFRSTVLAMLTLCLVLAVASGGALAAKMSARAGRVEAIVLTENAYVRSGPGDANPRLAEIHEGLKVRVISERTGWYQVRLANGLTGWLRDTEAETI